MAAEAVPRFCVLGGGVSGLTTAYLLQRALPRARVTIAGGSAGGLVKSTRAPSGHIYEGGPRSSVLVDKSGREALGLVKMLGLGENVVSANIEASARRHLFHHGSLQLFPRSGHVLRFLPALIAEPLWPRGRAEDESVHAFVHRRASRGVADRIADPICRGLLGGDARELSVRTCFPRLWFNERKFGSVFLGSALATFSAYQRRSWMALDLLDPLLQRVSAGGRVYTLGRGLSALTEVLEQRLLEPTSVALRPAEFRPPAARVVAPGGGDGSGAGSGPGGIPRGPVRVEFEDGSASEVDAVVASLPPAELAALLGRSGLDAPMVPAASGGDQPAGDTLCSSLGQVPHSSLSVVNMSFSEDVFKKRRLRGAGYFAGSLEGQDVLGMSWDSQQFPGAAAPSGGSTEPGAVGGARLTVHVGGEVASCSSADAAARAEECALAAVRSHLGIEDLPSDVLTTQWREALPQYNVGHHAWLTRFDGTRLANMPWLHAVGPGYYGARTVSDEVVDARVLTDLLARRFARFPVLVENELPEDCEQRYGMGFNAD